MIVGLGCMQANAQQFTFYETEQAFDRAQLKEVMIAVADLDPMANVFHSDDMTILQIKISPSVADHELRSAVSATGVVLKPGTPDLGTKYAATSHEPLYIATGDPESDHARYVEAVNSWNAANPERLMPTPIPQVDEQ